MYTTYGRIHTHSHVRGKSNPNDFNRIILLRWCGSRALNLGRVLRYWDLGKLTLLIGCYETKDTLNSFSIILLFLGHSF